MVVNDIGEINLDGRVLEGINVDRMVERSSGCICCSMSSQFGYALQEIVATTQAEFGSCCYAIRSSTGICHPGTAGSASAMSPCRKMTEFEEHLLCRT